MMRGAQAVAVLLAAVLALGATGAWGSARIDVRSPSELAAAFTTGVPNNPALFGFPSFQASVTGVLVYGTPGDLDGCDPLNATLIADERERLAEGGDIIVMVDRGDCSFSQKVYNAQQAGATAAIVVNNVTGSFLPFMRDDGKPQQPDIPSFIITMEDGDLFKNYTQRETVDSTVVLEMTWGLPHPDNRVEYRVWTTSVDPLSRDFKREFEAVAEALGDHAELEVSYYTLRGYRSTPEQYCINDNRYCSLAPEGATWPGKLVPAENLRQYCVWRYANHTAANPGLWWDYVNKWSDECLPTLSEANHVPCSERVLGEVGVPTAAVAQCVDDSQNPDGSNSILEGFLQRQAEERVFYLPFVLINEEPYRGSLSCPAPATYEHCGLLQALCAGFDPEALPDACKPNDGCPLLQFPDECSVCGGDGSTCKPKGDGGGVSVGTVLGIVIPLVIIVVLGVVFYVKRQRQQMRIDLDSILSSYMPLDSEGNPAPQGKSRIATAPDEETLM